MGKSSCRVVPVSKKELRCGAVGGGSEAQSEVFKAFRALRWLQRGVTTRPKEGELGGIGG